MKAMCQRLTQLALAMLVVVLIDVPSAAASWRTIAAAGTVDEAGTSRVLFGANGNAGFRDGVATPATLVIRYNVVPVDALFEPGLTIALGMRFADNGAGARVIVRLKRLAVDTGRVTTLATVDSDTYAAGEGYQHGLTCEVGEDPPFLFSGYAYFIEATLSKGNATGRPVLHEISLSTTDCIIFP